jgi:toxin FitB
VILVDTNVWSELTKTPCDQNVVNWLEAHEKSLWLSAIVIAEFQMGIEKLGPGRKRDWLTDWYYGLQIGYEHQILDFDTKSAHVFARLVVQRKLEKQETKLLDIQIAAQALAHDAMIATRNARDFAWTGVRLVNPWEG